MALAYHQELGTSLIFFSSFFLENHSIKIRISMWNNIKKTALKWWVFALQTTQRNIFQLWFFGSMEGRKTQQMFWQRQKNKNNIWGGKKCNISWIGRRFVRRDKKNEGERARRMITSMVFLCQIFISHQCEYFNFQFFFFLYDIHLDTALFACSCVFFSLSSWALVTSIIFQLSSHQRADQQQFG